MADTIKIEKNNKFIIDLEMIIKRKIDVNNEIIFITYDNNKKIIGYVIGKISKENIGCITDIYCGEDAGFASRIEEAVLCMIVDWFRTENCKSIQFDLKENTEITRKYEDKDMYKIFP